MSDPIDRQAALDVLCDACGNCACPNGKIPRCSYYEKMKAIPAASPWHRVEEPPKERDDYFAFTSDGEAKVCDYIPSVNQWWDGDYMILNVTHWMPIEPPKEE